MAAASRLGKQLEELISTLDERGVRFALIGGLALSSHNVVRATSDIDLLVDQSESGSVDALLLRLGYHCLHRSADAGNYQRADQRVDFLYASRPAARRLLNAAQSRATTFGALRVVGVEGLIGFKLQALVNDPRRTQDLEDIRALVRANRDVLDVGELRDYFRLFERESLLEEILGDDA